MTDLLPFEYTAPPLRDIGHVESIPLDAPRERGCPMYRTCGMSEGEGIGVALRRVDDDDEND